MIDICISNLCNSDSQTVHGWNSYTKCGRKHVDEIVVYQRHVHVHDIYTIVTSVIEYTEYANYYA